MNIKTKEELESFVSQNWKKINQWIDEQMKPLKIPVYSSVDIRESNEKFAPVDNNLYPAGFNNLCQLDLDASVVQFEDFWKSQGETSLKHIGLLCESHTKNLFYLDHLAYLKKALEETGVDVSIVSFEKSLFETSSKVSLLSHSKFELDIYEGKIEGDKAYLADQARGLDLIILNNDQSAPIPVDWSKLSTPVHPSPMLGWDNRSKSEHFQNYREVLQRFSEAFSVDTDLMMAHFQCIDGIDFSTKEGLESVGKAIDELQAQLPGEKNLFVKADQGTYGMGISVVKSGEEIINMNRKGRNKMDVGKNRKKFTKVIIQEGIDSSLMYEGMPAEVTIYLVGGKATGGFVRANNLKGAHENLNSKGMVFRRYCISEIRENRDHQCKEAVYSVIARLSTLASCLEIEKKHQAKG